MHNTEPITNANHVRIAVIFDSQFEHPNQWVKVGEWKISNNIICTYDHVSFYAVDPAAADELMQKLRTFSPQLPSTVQQSGEYLSTTFNE